MKFDDISKPLRSCLQNINAALLCGAEGFDISDQTGPGRVKPLYRIYTMKKFVAAWVAFKGDDSAVTALEYAIVAALVCGGLTLTFGNVISAAITAQLLAATT